MTKYRYTQGENVLIGTPRPEKDSQIWAAIITDPTLENVWIRKGDWQVEEIKPSVHEQLEALPIGGRFQSYNASLGGHWIKVTSKRAVYVYSNGDVSQSSEALAGFRNVPSIHILGENE
jgi:hypothetical protein